MSKMASHSLLFALDFILVKHSSGWVTLVVALKVPKKEGLVGISYIPVNHVQVVYQPIFIFDIGPYHQEGPCFIGSKKVICSQTTLQAR